jgi:UPF0716 protein FxsA
MAIFVLVLFIGVPLIEIALFIEVGGLIGLWPTVATVMLTAVIGTVLLRQQGMATLQRAQAEMAAQRMPVRELFDGACLLAAGILLLTPGFLTDAIGFALLIPALRGIVGRLLWQAVQRSGTVHVHTESYTTRSDGRGPIIEAEYEDVTAPGDNGRPLPGRDDDRAAGRRGDPNSPWRQEER